MRILVISNIFPPGFIGGYELGAREIVDYLCQHGDDIQVLTSESLDREGDRETAPYPINRSLVYVIEKPSRLQNRSKFKNYWANESNLRIIESTINEFNPDLILGFNLRGLGVYSILNLFQATNTPTCLYLMDDYLSGINLKSLSRVCVDLSFRKEKLTNVLQMISMTDRLADQFSDHDLVSVSHFSTIPGWVDISHIGMDRPLETEKIRQFIYASRISEHKGVYLILEALRGMRPEELSRLHIKLFGDGEHPKLDRMIEDIGLSKYVSVSTSITKSLLGAELGGADFLLFPTWEKEPFGFIVVEAMANGCIPIVTNGIGVTHYLDTGNNSILIERDIKELRDAMRASILMSEDKISEMKLSARRTAEEFFDSAQVLSDVRSTLNNIFLRNKSEDSQHKNKRVSARRAIPFHEVLLINSIDSIALALKLFTIRLFNLRL
jgi:glycogen(starch) synthase